MNKNEEKSHIILWSKIKIFLILKNTIVTAVDDIGDGAQAIQIETGLPKWAVIGRVRTSLKLDFLATNKKNMRRFKIRT